MPSSLCLEVCTPKHGQGRELHRGTRSRTGNKRVKGAFTVSFSKLACVESDGSPHGRKKCSGGAEVRSAMDIADNPISDPISWDAWFGIFTLRVAPQSRGV